MEKHTLRRGNNSVGSSRVWSVDTGSEDARKTLRYNVRAKAVFHWPDGNGSYRESEGLTRDVSPKGAYVFSADCPPRGAPVQMTIDLPSMGNGSNNMRIRAECRVLRVDKTASKQNAVGFSVENIRVALCAN